MSSPAITHLSWGKLEVADHGTFKDAKLWPGGARAWDWSETGTRHEPGIQPADVAELLAQGAEVVVLSRGMHERLLTCPDTLALLEERGVEVHVLQTEEAVATYESLRTTRPVGALIHSTC
ncbi:MAG TPA: hypothetical protein DEA08_04645 [Planctomycetes bacterium]|nr:hypothetical protein [Planctomycetota bacterium]